MRVAPAIHLNEEQKSVLTALTRSRLTSVRLVQRAKIILMASKGMQNIEIAKHLGIGRIQVARWRERYLQWGLEGIEQDLPRSGPPSKIDHEHLLAMTLEPPPMGSEHWTTRKMGSVLGVSPSTILRHWHEGGLKPKEISGMSPART